MSFEHDRLVFNLLDTPGHQDFSEHTYRTLTAGSGGPIDHAIAIIAWYFLGHRRPRSGARLTLHGVGHGAGDT
jgi:hypothetical protein